MKDPALAQNPQLMIMVGGRADKIIQAMKDFDLLKSALEELGSLK
jgi:3-hydroxyisobutyrate dehydrogenase-like beta-hydroxyacid dehydrogenase